MERFIGSLVDKEFFIKKKNDHSEIGGYIKTDCNLFVHTINIQTLKRVFASTVFVPL